MIELVRLVSGLVLWAIAFSTLYALHGLGCSLGWSKQVVFGLSQSRMLLLAAWILFVAIQCGLLRRMARQKETHLDWMARAIGWIGLVATLVTGLPIIAISSCV